MVSEHECQTLVPQGLKTDDLEDFLAQHWGVWAVLIPEVRWPRLGCFPPLLAFESFPATQNWVREQVWPRPAPRWRGGCRPASGSYPILISYPREAPDPGCSSADPRSR
jgi:hypothetical protein